MGDNSAGTSIGGGAASGAASGAIAGAALGGVGAVPGAAIGAVVGAGAGYLQYAGGKKAAKARQAAIDRWTARRKELLGNLRDDQWQGSRDQQAALTSYLKGMPLTASAENAMPMHTPGQQVDLTQTTAKMTPEDRANYIAAFNEANAVPTAQMAAGNAAANQGMLAKTMNDSRDMNQVLIVGSRRDRRRYANLIGTQLADNDAQLNGDRPPNSAYNLQMLGSLLGAGSQLGMTLAARAPGPSGGGGKGPQLWTGGDSPSSTYSSQA